MKFKLAHWEMVLFIFANLICAVSYILPVLLIAGLFMLADLATTPGNSIRVFNFIYFLFTLVYLLGKTLSYGLQFLSSVNLVVKNTNQ